MAPVFSDNMPCKAVCCWFWKLQQQLAVPHFRPPKSIICSLFSGRFAVLIKNMARMASLGYPLFFGAGVAVQNQRGKLRGPAAAMRTSKLRGFELCQASHSLFSLNQTQASCTKKSGVFDIEGGKPRQSRTQDLFVQNSHIQHSESEYIFMAYTVFLPIQRT